MIGVSAKSPRLKRYEEAIATGRQLLMVVDVPAQRVDKIGRLIANTIPMLRPRG